MKVIVVSYTGKVEGVCLVNDDEAEEVYEKIVEVNSRMQDPVTITVHTLDTVEELLEYLGDTSSSHDLYRSMATVRGERVKVLGPKPEDWEGLGSTTGTILVEFPDGEVQAVKEEQIAEVVK